MANVADRQRAASAMATRGAEHQYASAGSLDLARDREAAGTRELLAPQASLPAQGPDAEGSERPENRDMLTRRVHPLSVGDRLAVMICALGAAVAGRSVIPLFSMRSFPCDGRVPACRKLPRPEIGPLAGCEPFRNSPGRSRRPR